MSRTPSAEHVGAVMLAADTAREREKLEAIADSPPPIPEVIQAINNHTCPGCGEDLTDAEHDDLDGQTLIQTCTCSGCSASVTNYYHLTSQYFDGDTMSKDKWYRPLKAEPSPLVIAARLALDLLEKTYAYTREGQRWSTEAEQIALRRALAEHDKNNQKPGCITIEVRGGCVVDVRDLPENWQYELIDWDNQEGEDAEIPD